MKQRRIKVIIILTLILGTSLASLLYILFAPKPVPDYYTIAMPHPQSYGNLTMPSRTSMRNRKPVTPWYPSGSSYSQTTSPANLVATPVKPVGFLLSKAKAHSFGVMPYSGGNYAAATGSSHQSSSYSSPTAVSAPVMPITHFLALSSAKTLSERTAAAAPVVDEPRPAPMARTAVAPHYAPGPPDTGGGLNPGNENHQLTDPAPIGDVLPLFLFALLAATVIGVKKMFNTTVAQKNE